MEEYLIVSCNFRCPVDVVIAGRHVTGQVEELDDERARIGGAWYPIREMEWAVQ